MNIEHVRAFLEIAEMASFQDAAEKLNITQSTISARIKTLEERLGGALFHRGRKGIALTEKGQLFRRHAMTLVLAWERARQEASMEPQREAVISLGLQFDHWTDLMQPWMDWMAEHAPQVATRAVADYSDRLMQQLRDGLLDLAVLFQAQYGPDVIVERFRNEALILVTTDPEQTDIAAMTDYVYIDWGEVFRAEQNTVFPNLPAPRLSIGITAVGLDHILRNGGSAYFLDRDVKPLIDAERLHRVKDAPVFNYPTHLVRPRSPVNEALIETAARGLRYVVASTHRPA